MSNAIHTPVLSKEAIDSLVTKPEGFYLDATAGFGGHTKLILERLSKEGRLIASDRDKDSISYIHKKISDPKLIVLKSSFKELNQKIGALEVTESFDGIIADLGVSSYQLDTSERGFSFMKDADLDMRMDQGESVSAKDWINSASKEEITKVIWELGEETYSRKIAESIFEQRKTKPINRTSQLAKLILDVKRNNKKEKRHPATKTFQAIRMHINQELDQLRSLLDFCLERTKKGGRISIISFHSLEDRVVKRFFRDNSRIDPRLAKLPNIDADYKLKIILKKIKASDEEIKNNPRSRSAILRTAEKMK